MIKRVYDINDKTNVQETKDSSKDLINSKYVGLYLDRTDPGSNYTEKYYVNVSNPNLAIRHDWYDPKVKYDFRDYEKLTIVEFTNDKRTERTEFDVYTWSGGVLGSWIKCSESNCQASTMNEYGYWVKKQKTQSNTE